LVPLLILLVGRQVRILQRRISADAPTRRLINPITEYSLHGFHLTGSDLKPICGKHVYLSNKILPY